MKTELHITKQNLNPHNDLQKIDEIIPGIYLFVSFDLDNSTKFKTQNKNENWPSVFMYFYNLTDAQMKNNFHNISKWKQLGDEILFYTKIEKEGELYEAPHKVYEIQGQVIKNLFSKYDYASDLAIKATMWVAKVSRHNTDSSDRNIYYSLKKEKESTIDFLGEDIDIGFRIAKHAFKGKITISAEYAYLLHRMKIPPNQNNIGQNLRIVAYQKLKGVWNDRAYPIIWYDEDWKTIKDRFQYDDHITNDIVRNIHTLALCEEIAHLENILAEVDRREYQDRLNKACSTLRDKTTD